MKLHCVNEAVKTKLILLLLLKLGLIRMMDHHRMQYQQYTKPSKLVY